MDDGGREGGSTLQKEPLRVSRTHWSYMMMGDGVRFHALELDLHSATSEPETVMAVKVQCFFANLGIFDLKLILIGCLKTHTD